jgi:hypothetical protein
MQPANPFRCISTLVSLVLSALLATHVCRNMYHDEGIVVTNGVCVRISPRHDVYRPSSSNVNVYMLQLIATNDASESH